MFSLRGSTGLEGERVHFTVPAAIPAGIPTMAAPPVVERTHRAGCCMFAPTHVLQKYIQHAKWTENVPLVEELRERLDHIEKVLMKVRTVVLEKALDICRDLHRDDEVEELHTAIQDHFQKHIERFSERGLREEAEKLRGHLREIRANIEEGKQLFNAEALQEKLQELLSKKARKVDADNQVYNIQYEPLTHREKLPGKIARKTGDKSTNVRQVDLPYDYSESVAAYAATHGIDFKRVAPERPRVTTVGAEKLPNAYWTPQKRQIVIGDGVPIFNNLAGDSSVIMHEWWHAITENEAGRNLGRATGLDYSPDDAGAQNEAYADIGAVAGAIWDLGTTDPVSGEKIEVSVRDPRVRELYKVGRGLWLDGAPDDALRDLKDGIGYSETGKLAKKIGRPVEQFFLKWSAWHDNQGRVHNPLAVKRKESEGKRLIKGSEDEVDPHHGSACPNAVFIEQLELLDFLGIYAQTVHGVWVESLQNLSARPTLRARATDTIAVIRSWESELGMGDRPAQALMNGWRKFEVPFDAPGR